MRGLEAGRVTQSPPGVVCKTLSLQRKRACPWPGPDQYMAGGVFGLTPTVAGYTLMTRMAEAAINTLGQTPGGGYLQNVEQRNEDLNEQLTNVNSGLPGTVFQFTSTATTLDQPAPGHQAIRW
jgi:hypothetical protein